MIFVNSSWSLLEFLYYLSTPILVIIGATGLFGLYQAKKEFNYNVEKESIHRVVESTQRAIELTQYYVKEIIPRLNELEIIFSGSQYEAEINKFDQHKFKNFDLLELSEIIMENHKGESDKVVITNISKSFSEILNNNINTKNENVDLSVLTNRFMLEDLLNNLEYFAMNFVTGIADNETVYRAMHRTYIATVQKMYFHIARVNGHPKYKFYNNIIELYQQWICKELEIAEEYNQRDLDHAQAIRVLGHHKGNTLK